MNGALRRPMTPDEFDGIQPVALMGGTAKHSETATNLAKVLRRALAGTR